MRGCTSPGRCRTAPRSAGTGPADGRSPSPEPEGTQQEVSSVFGCSGLSGCWCLDSHLDEGEGGPRGKGLMLVFNLVPEVLLHSLLLEHLLLLLGPEQDPGRHGDGHCVLWLRLQEQET